MVAIYIPLYGFWLHGTLLHYLLALVIFDTLCTIPCLVHKSNKETVIKAIADKENRRQQMLDAQRKRYQNQNQNQASNNGNVMTIDELKQRDINASQRANPHVPIGVVYDFRINVNSTVVSGWKGPEYSQFGSVYFTQIHPKIQKLARDKLLNIRKIHFNKSKSSQSFIDNIKNEYIVFVTSDLPSLYNTKDPTLVFSLIKFDYVKYQQYQKKNNLSIDKNARGYWYFIRVSRNNNYNNNSNNGASSGDDNPCPLNDGGFEQVVVTSFGSQDAIEAANKEGADVLVVGTADKNKNKTKTNNKDDVHEDFKEGTGINVPLSLDARVSENVNKSNMTESDRYDDIAFGGNNDDNDFVNRRNSNVMEYIEQESDNPDVIIDYNDRLERLSTVNNALIVPIQEATGVKDDHVAAAAGNNSFVSSTGLDNINHMSEGEEN